MTKYGCRISPLSKNRNSTSTRYFHIIYNCRFPLAQNVTVCSTAVWNSSVQVIAGVTSSSGNASTQLNNPIDVFYDANRRLFVADYTNNRIQKFVYGSTTGTTISGLSLLNPTAVHVTNTDILYIVDYSNYRIQKWNNGVVATVAGGRGSGSTLDKMSTSYALYVDVNFNIYISEHGNHRVSLWSAGNTTVGHIVSISMFRQLLFIMLLINFFKLR